MEVEAEIEKVPPNWPELPAEIKTLIVSKMDNATKRALRQTDGCNNQIVHKFRFMNYSRLYYCSLEEETLEDGGKRYSIEHGIDRDYLTTDDKKYFPTFEEMIDSLQDILEMIDTIERFYLTIKGFSEPIQLLRNRRKMKVQHLTFNMETEPRVIMGFSDQFYFDMQRDGSYDIVENFSGQEFIQAYQVLISGIDERADGGEAERFANSQMPGPNSTVLGLKQLLMEMLHNIQIGQITLEKLSPEETNLFDYDTRIGSAHVFINPVNASSALKLQLTRPCQKPPKLVVVRVSKELVSGNVPARLGPSLQEFVRSIESEF